jgi:hypothetical protein
MRLSQKGKSVILEVAFWWDEQDHAVHVVGNDPEPTTFHVAVRNDPAKPSGHPYLFRELVKCLRQMDAPSPPEAGAG